ncbi:hypothetical protein MPSEU_001082800 [Mayamaea pseudoterrestris]|nr:hypothetical protein MPSEU_001082800 [Mayamaea pseudoterrestris]
MLRHSSPSQTMQHHSRDDQSTEASRKSQQPQRQPREQYLPSEAATGIAGSHRNCIAIRIPNHRPRNSKNNQLAPMQRPPPGLKAVPVQLLPQQSQSSQSSEQPVKKPYMYERMPSFSTSNSSAASLASRNVREETTSTAGDAQSSSSSLSSHQAPSQFSASNQPQAKPLESLLKLPAPQDRSSKLQYERRKRLQQGVYEGELEPVGRRGDEAIATLSSTDESEQQEQEQDEHEPLTPLPLHLTNASTLPQMRDFTKPPQPPLKLVQKSPLPPSQVRQTRVTNIVTPKGLLKSFSYDDEDADDLDLLPPEPRRVTQLSSPTTSSRSTAFHDDDENDDESRIQPIQLDPESGRVVHGVRGSESGEHTKHHQHFESNKAKLLQPTLTASSTESDDDLLYLRPDASSGSGLRPHEMKHDNTSRSNHVSTQQLSMQDASAPPSPSSVVVTSNIALLNTLAMQHVQSNEFDMALDCFSRVLVLLQDLHADNPKHPAIASCHHNLGTLHAKRAQVVEPESAQQKHLRLLALQEFQAAARTARDGLGRNHPNVAVSLVRIGFLLLQSRQYQNAIVTFQEALRIRIAAFGTTKHALVANLYNNLGVCHLHLGQFEKGLDYLQGALEIQRSIGDVIGSSATTASFASSTHLSKENEWIQQLELADTLFNIGGLCLEWIRRRGPDSRRAVDAENAFSEALELRQRVLGPDDPMVLQVKALLDMARALPRPGVRKSSPTRSKQDPFGRLNGSPRHDNRASSMHTAHIATNMPSARSPKHSPGTKRRSNEPASISINSRPFDEPSRQRQPQSVTPLSWDPKPAIIRTPPRRPNVPIVTPPSDRIANHYGAFGVKHQRQSPRWLAPTSSSNIDKGDAPVIKSSSRVLLAPQHLVPASPPRRSDTDYAASRPYQKPSLNSHSKESFAGMRENSNGHKDISYSTGNPERDELMNRAKALLENMKANDDASASI